MGRQIQDGKRREELSAEEMLPVLQQDSKVTVIGQEIQGNLSIKIKGDSCLCLSKWNREQF